MRVFRAIVTTPTLGAGMATQRDDMLAEQILEVRYPASGSFLDVRGSVADQIRTKGFLSHWSIEPNIINFRDDAEAVNKEMAFVGYKSAGYVVQDAPTKNFFQERAALFWRHLRDCKDFPIPKLERFGARSKIFIPTDKTFQEVYKAGCAVLYTPQALELGATLKDVQFVFQLKTADGFEGRISGGPVAKDEAAAHLNSDSPLLSKAGFFIDVDLYKSSGIEHDDVSKLLRDASALHWAKADAFAAAIGI